MKKVNFAVTPAVLAAAGLLLLGGCTNTARMDAAFDKGWRPSKGQCAFGGETEKVDAYCATQNFGSGGTEMVLRSINREVLDESQFGSGSGGALSASRSLLCTDHVVSVKAKLAPYGSAYRSENIYSCDAPAVYQDGREVCHVSVVVTDMSSNKQYVLDNGHVFGLVATGGVGSYKTFYASVGRSWTGEAQRDFVSLLR